MFGTLVKGDSKAPFSIVTIYIYIYIYIFGRIKPKTLKMVLDTSLLNTQQCKVHIKGKVEQFRERSSALPYTSV